MWIRRHYLRTSRQFGFPRYKRLWTFIPSSHDKHASNTVNEKYVYLPLHPSEYSQLSSTSKCVTSQHILFTQRTVAQDENIHTTIVSWPNTTYSN